MQWIKNSKKIKIILYIIKVLFILNIKYKLKHIIKIFLYKIMRIVNLTN